MNNKPTTMANYEATKLSASELAEWLTGFANQNEGGLVDYEHANMLEAASRLSRYDPVKIDPEDEGTWPTEEDYVGGILLAWPEDVGEWRVIIRRHAEEWLNDYPHWYTHWRRINNETPEGE